MPKEHLVALVVRLALGFLVVALLGAFLFSRLRKPAEEVATSSPTPTPLAPVDDVVVVTPTPVVEPTLLPTEDPDRTQVLVLERDARGKQQPVLRASGTRATESSSSRVIFTQEHSQRTTTTSRASSGEAHASASASAGGSSATATATAGNASASASASAQ